MIQPDEQVANVANKASTFAFPLERPVKVALVENHTKIRENWIRLINSFPDLTCVYSCGSAEEALAVIPEKLPDVVLMDIFLPRRSGIECTARLKAQLPGLQILMFTAMEDLELLIMSLEAGADGYLLKRTSPADLRKAILEVLGGGVPMTPHISRRLIESFRDRSKNNDKSWCLTTREEQIVHLVSQGLTNSLIAQRLGLSIETVSSHMKRVFKKLQVGSRTEASIRYLDSKAFQRRPDEARINELKRNQKNLFRYFPVSMRNRKLGWHVTTVGKTRILPGEAYPVAGHPKGYNFDWSKGRVLNCHALVYISHGRGSFESRQSGKHPIEAGQVFFLFPGVWHRYRPDAETGWDEHWVGFDGDVARQHWVKNGLFSPRTPVFKLRQEEKWLALFTELVAVLKLNHPELQQVMAGFTAQMLGLLYFGQQTELLGDDQVLLIVQGAIAKMQTELERGFDAQALARELNVSYSSFRHTFQQHTGFSPHQYLLELRLMRARNLLTQTTQNIYKIAQQAGFEDERYFSRFFKMKTGLTPGQWRLRSRPSKLNICLPQLPALYTGVD